MESPDSPVTITYTQSQVGAGSRCSGAFTDVLVNDGSNLRVNAYAQYEGAIKFKEINKTFDFICTSDDGGPPLKATLPAPFEVAMDMKGAAVKLGLDKKLKPQHPFPEITVTGDWSFAAITP